MAISEDKTIRRQDKARTAALRFASLTLWAARFLPPFYSNVHNCGTHLADRRGHRARIRIQKLRIVEALGCATEDRCRRKRRSGDGCILHSDVDASTRNRIQEGPERLYCADYPSFV